MKNDKVMFPYLIIFIVAFCISVLGASYAYFAVSSSNSNSISGDAAIVSIDLNVSKVFPSGDDGNKDMIPQLSGSALDSALKSGCIDSNSNAVCQVYKISVKNSGSAQYTVNGSVSFFSDNVMQVNVSNAMPNLRWMIASSVDEVNSHNSILGSSIVYIANSEGSVFARNVEFASLDENIYYLVVWVNETNNSQVDLDNSFYGRVMFVSSNGSGVTATFS